MADGMKIVIQSQIDEGQSQINSLNNQIKSIAGKLEKLDLKN